MGRYSTILSNEEEFEIRDLQDLDFLEIYDNATAALSDEMNAAAESEVPELEKLQLQVKATKKFVDIISGEGEGERVFKGECNIGIMFEILRASIDFRNKFNEELNTISKSALELLK